VTAISLFFVFGAIMSGLAGIILAFPGTKLDALWRINPRGHEGFVAMGAAAVLLMTIVCALCAVVAAGLWRCNRVGLWIAVSMLTVNLIGDCANAVMFRDWRTLIGIPVAGVMIVYLLKQRSVFREVQ
jgi:hypothetical protein